MPELDPALTDRIAEIDEMGVPEWHALSVESARRVEDELFSTDATIPVAGTTDLAIAGGETGADTTDGSSESEIPIRVYRPHETPAPTLVFLHGGGWTLGTLDSADGICRRLCRRVGAVVVSVDYRLAPEHPFPAAVEDAVRAVAWADDHADSLGGDGRLGVAGTSAGGGLAAAVGLASTDETAFGFSLDADLAVQALFYPALTPRFDTASYREHADGPLLTKADMRWFWSQYLGSPADAHNPYAAPLRADALSGVPPAVIATGSHDPLRDDGAAYATRLADEGIPLEYREFDGLAHGFLSFAGDAAEGGVPAADEAFDEVADAVAAQFE
jgi:acetyl esterase